MKVEVGVRLLRVQTLACGVCLEAVTHCWVSGRMLANLEVIPSASVFSLRVTILRGKGFHCLS